MTTPRQTSAVPDALIPAGRREAVARAVEAAFPSARIDRLTPLTGGASGAQVFKALIQDRAYLLRIEGEPDGFRDPARQYACLKIAAEAGVAPPILYADARDGVAITGFIQAGAAPKRPRAAHIAAIVDAVRALHAAPLFPRLVDFMDGMDIILGQLHALAILPPEAFEATRDAYDASAALYPRGDGDLVSSHNDLHPRNLLFERDRLWIIDWETAFAADRYVDLAAIANFHAADEAEEAIILRRYFRQPPSDEQRARLFLMRQIGRLFYAIMMLNAAARERPGARLTAADIEAPGFDAARGGVGDLTNFEGRVRFGCLWLNEAIRGVKSPRFAPVAARMNLR